MGAKKNKGKKNGQSNDVEEVEVKISDEQQRLFEEALITLRGLVDDIHSIGAPIREWALSLTKMEEAEMWIERGFDMLGIEPTVPDDDDDADDDDDDTADSEEE